MLPAFASDIRLTALSGLPYRTSRLELCLLSELTDRSPSEVALLFAVLFRSSAHYPTLSELKRRLDELWSAEIDSLPDQFGPTLCRSICISFADDRYLPHPTDTPTDEVFGGVLDLLSELLFCPLVESDAFDPQIVESEKANLIARLEDTDNRRLYARTRMESAMFEGERFSICCEGDPAILRSITPESLYRFYLGYLDSVQIAAFYCGPRGHSEVKRAVAECLSPLARSCQRSAMVGESASLPLDHGSLGKATIFPTPEHGSSFIKNSPTPECGDSFIKNSERFRWLSSLPLSDPKSLPDRPLRKLREVADVSQGRLCLGFRTGENIRSENYPAVRLAFEMLGAAPNSRLFDNLREKNGLCYSCSLTDDPYEGFFCIECGIDSERADAVCAIVFEQLEALGRGEFDDVELDCCKKSMISYLNSIDDDSLSQIAFLIEQSVCDPQSKDEVEPDTSLGRIIDRVRTVGRAELAAIFRGFRPDTVFFLCERGKASASTSVWQDVPPRREDDRFVNIPAKAAPPDEAVIPDRADRPTLHFHKGSSDLPGLALEHPIPIAHPSGLTIEFYPMKRSGIRTSLRVDFGGYDLRYRSGDRIIELPPGTAHYLEHKLFDGTDGLDITPKFTEHSAFLNAATSGDSTVYSIHAADPSGFERVLGLLLDRITNPFFSPKTIRKERPIIAEEIRGYRNIPESRLEELLLGGLYHRHPAKIDICGRIGDLRSITPELLYRVHRDFYRPDRMVLAVVGSADPDRILGVCDRFFPTPRTDAPCILLPEDEPEGVRRRHQKRALGVSRPLFGFAIKDRPCPVGAEGVRKTALLTLIDELCFGYNSPLTNRLYERSIVPSAPLSSPVLGRSLGHLLYLASGDDPSPFFEEAERYLDALATHKPDVDRLERARRSYLGGAIMATDDPELLCDELLFERARIGFDFVDEYNAIASVSADEIESELARMLAPDRICFAEIVGKSSPEG